MGYVDVAIAEYNRVRYAVLDGTPLGPITPLVCQLHPDRMAVSPLVDAFLCSDCATACQWCNEQGGADACDRDHVARERDGFRMPFGRDYLICTEGVREYEHTEDIDAEFDAASVRYGW